MNELFPESYTLREGGSEGQYLIKFKFASRKGGFEFVIH